MGFLSRTAAGRKLARALRPFAKSGSIVFALPRGGVVVAAGMHYASFPQVDDNTVKALPERSKHHAVRQTAAINP